MEGDLIPRVTNNLLPILESVAAIWMLGLYAMLNGTLWVVIGFEARSLASELVEVE